jgi:hypothetical protein
MAATLQPQTPQTPQTTPASKSGQVKNPRHARFGLLGVSRKTGSLFGPPESHLWRHHYIFSFERALPLWRPPPGKRFKFSNLRPSGLLLLFPNLRFSAFICGKMVLLLPLCVSVPSVLQVLLFRLRRFRRSRGDLRVFYCRSRSALFCVHPAAKWFCFCLCVSLSSGFRFCFSDYGDSVRLRRFRRSRGLPAPPAFVPIHPNLVPICPKLVPL